MFVGVVTLSSVSCLLLDSLAGLFRTPNSCRKSEIRIIMLYIYSKTCLMRPLKIRQNKVLKTNGSLIKVESIAECSKRAFCNTFDPH